MTIVSLFRKLVPFLVACLVLVLGIGLGTAAEKKADADKQKKLDHKKAFAIYKKKCLLCHDSVADPEKPGRTQDEWLLVLKTMHKYGLDLNSEQTELIGGLLYELRRGMEKEPG